MWMNELIIPRRFGHRSLIESAESPVRQGGLSISFWWERYTYCIAVLRSPCANLAKSGTGQSSRNSLMSAGFVKISITKRQNPMSFLRADRIISTCRGSYCRSWYLSETVKKKENINLRASSCPSGSSFWRSN